MGPSSPTYDVGTPTSDNEIQSMKGNEDSFGFNLDQTGCGQVPIIPLSGSAFILDHIFQKPTAFRDAASSKKMGGGTCPPTSGVPGLLVHFRPI